ncbi:MAG: DNA polymerase I [Calditrichaceae bacterium]|nr:DNA polymerase I [Calditrichaceae bacterium]
MPEKLFLIDGSALYYRSYFAFIRNPLINSKGEDTSATFGFLSSMTKLIEDEKPEYLAVIFDTKEPTFRHEIYPEYKATREKMPEEMAAQFPRLIDTLRRLNFVLLDKAGYEADDIIGTLSSKYAGKNLHVYIVSGDKDMAQLVNEHVFLYSLGKSDQASEVLNRDKVIEKMGIKPEQVVDWLALMGDSSDNIPGIPKVGNKTAVSILQEYQSIEGLYANIDAYKEGVVKNNLIEFKDQTDLSRKLAMIHKDVPIDVSISDLKFRLWDMQILDDTLKELEFRRLFNRMTVIGQAAGHAETYTHHDEKSVKYVLIKSMQAFDGFLDELKKQKEFVFDLETSSLDFLLAEIAGIAISWEEDKAWYIPVTHPDISLKKDEVLSKLKPIFSDAKVKKIGQNIKYDAMIMRQHGVDVKGIYFDTMIASYLINPTGQHKLDKLSEYYLNYEMIHIEELIGSGKKQKLMTDLFASEVAPYAAEDADITFKLYKILKEQIEESGMQALLYDLEMPLMEVLMKMEEQGIKLDTDQLRKLSKTHNEQLTQLQKDIYESANEEFNLNSPAQLGTVLFDRLEIHKDLNLKRPPRTKTGQYSTNEKILERFIMHPIVDKILEYRRLSKLINTYLDALPGLVSEKTGRLHTSFNQTVAVTGRLSSSNPNLQNIPIRTEIGREIRNAFVPSRAEYKILSADYSQIELRIMAHLSGDKAMMQAFKDNLDIHASTASLIFDLPLDQVGEDQRRRAKAINFGIIYGMSSYGLASRLHISNEEAQDFIMDYMATYPDVQAYMQKSIEVAKEQGYVETMMKRRRYLPEIRSDNRQIREFAERTAINTPIQGSAADLIKKAMIEVQDYIENKNLDAVMLLQVHDELVFEVNDHQAEKIIVKIKEIMENAVKLDVPVIVDCGIGNNWLEAH